MMIVGFMTSAEERNWLHCIAAICRKVYAGCCKLLSLSGYTIL